MFVELPPPKKKGTGKVTAAGFSEITRHAIRVPYRELDDAVGLNEFSGPFAKKKISKRRDDPRQCCFSLSPRFVPPGTADCNTPRGPNASQPRGSPVESSQSIEVQRGFSPPPSAFSRTGARRATWGRAHSQISRVSAAPAAMVVCNPANEVIHPMTSAPTAGSP